MRTVSRAERRKRELAETWQTRYDKLDADFETVKQLEAPPHCRGRCHCGACAVTSGSACFRKWRLGSRARDRE